MEGVLQGKFVRVAATQKDADAEEREYQENCSKESIQAAVNGAVRLLNLPSAIQQKATLQSQPRNTIYEVASRDAKNGNLLCTVLKDHVKCRCPSFMYDSVCMHSIAVAQRADILEAHVRFVVSAASHQAKSKTALAEANVNKGIAGKKGSRNKTPYRPQPIRATHKTNDAASSKKIYNEIHHNDNPFILHILPQEAKSCKQCRNNFCHRIRVVPHDLVFEHKEKYYFPLNGDWKNKQVSNREASRYYHADAKCMRDRFPYFCNEYVKIPDDVKDRLLPSHKDHFVRNPPPLSNILYYMF